MATAVKVTVAPDRIALAPGGCVDVEVTIQNASPVVEHFATSMLGLPSNDLFSCEPEVVKLRPREVDTVRVRISLPERGGLLAGEYTLGVLVRSPYQREVSRCEELPLAVRPVPALTMGVQPEVATGGPVGEYTVHLANEGNTPLAVTLAGADQENRVGFEIRPRELRLEPGTTGDAQVTARTAPPLTGQEVRRQLTLRAHAEDVVAEKPVSFVQRPRIRGGLMKVGGATAALALLAGATLGGALLIRDAKGPDSPTPTPAANSEPPGPQPTGESQQPPPPTSAPTSAPPSSSTEAAPSSSEPTSVETDVFADFEADGQKTGERLISNDRYAGQFGITLDTLTDKAPPGCEDADAQALRTSRTLGFGSFLTSAKPTNATACQTMPIRMEFAKPARTVQVGFTGTGAEYQLTVRFSDGQTEVRTAKSTTAGAIVMIPYEAPDGREITSVTFWHANPDPTAKDPTLIKSIGYSPA